MSSSLLGLYAIIVGNNGSPAPDVQPLRYADDDAVAYAQLLQDAGAEVRLLTRYDEDSRALHTAIVPFGPPTMPELLRAVDEAPSGAEIYLVYTGHGDVADGEGFVQLQDARLSRTRLYNDVLARLSRPSQVHVVIDACKSYFLVFERGPGGQRSRYDGRFVDSRGIERFPNVGFVLSTSSAADSHEWEEWQAGVFSHEVRSALRGAADVDGDGKVSYLEIGAFVHQANLGIPNARFRPKFTVFPPRSSAQGLRTPMLSWNGARRRDLAIDMPVGRFFLEEARGIRILDAHPDRDTKLLLHLPKGATFLRAADEYEVPAEGNVSLAALTARPPVVARRGALHEAFKHLFVRPFGPAAIREYQAAPSPSLGREIAPSPKNNARRVMGWTALGFGVAGIALTVSAYAVRRTSDESQASRADANDTIDALNAAAFVCYSAFGAAGATWLVLSFGPRSAQVGVSLSR